MYKVVTGILYQGRVTSRVFAGAVFKQPPASVPTDCLVSDFPKIAYDATTGTVYITAWAVVFNDGTIGPALFVSHDGGKSFLEHKLGNAQARVDSVPRSVDVTPDSLLRVLIIFGGRLAILRFDRDAENFDIADSGPDLSRGIDVARVSDRSNRYWLVWRGPEIAIDSSTRQRGRIYTVWSKAETVVRDPSFSWNGMYGKNFDIFFAYSDDDGNTWSQPQKVNDDVGQGDQVFPSVDVDSNGVVHVAFLDKRENPNLPQYDVYYAKIVDGRVSRNIRLNPTHVPNSVGGREPGDYLKMIVAYPDKVYVSYPCGSWKNVQAGDACLTALDPRRVPFPGEFIRGDSTQDFIIDISDAVNILGYLFTGGGSVTCEDAADTNDDGRIDLSDAIFLLDFLFKGEPKQLPPPYGQFGKDPTQDSLNC
jgi:hypothetical protein